MFTIKPPASARRDRLRLPFGGLRHSLVKRAAGPGKVKELLDRARKRLVENGVEHNPGPFGFRLAFRRVTGRAVFADKQKQLLDRAFAWLVEQGIEPHPGPDVGASRQDDEHLEGFSWPCEACGQVLWASDMTRLSQLRNRHISRKHPDVSKLCFRRLGRLRQADAPEPADTPGPASGRDARTGACLVACPLSF